MSSPEAVDHAVSVVTDWLGWDWLERQLASIPHPAGGSLLKQTARRRPIHPMVALVARAGDWRECVEGRRLPPDQNEFFRFIGAARTIEAAARLDGGPAYLADLRDRFVLSRTTQTNIQHFWSHLFEAEVALEWNLAGLRAGFGPPGGNPDVVLRCPGLPVIPIECY